MHPESCHTVLFLPSISPTSSREEFRQCARIMANKGHQCLLVEFPGFHTDPHINNRIQQKIEIDDDGIYHLKEDLSFGVDEIKLPQEPLRAQKKETSMLKLAFLFAKGRIEQRRAKTENVALLSGAAGLLERTDQHSNKAGKARVSDSPAHEAVPKDGTVPKGGTVQDDGGVPYNHIYRSFLRQYLRFVLLQWGAAPLSVVTMGQSSSFFLQAVDDLIALGRGHRHVEDLASQLNQDDWVYTQDGQRSDLDDQEIIGGDDDPQISRKQACEIVRDAIVADLIRMHLHTAVFGSPYWKSSGRTYFEGMGVGEAFTTPIRQYVMARICNLWTYFSLIGDYWHMRRHKEETFYR